MEYVFNSVGSWRSVDELEESITLEELHRLFLTQQRIEYNAKAFSAALKGVQLDPYDDPDYEDVTTFAELQERVAVKQREALGVGSSHPELEAMGLMVEEY